MAEAAPPHCDSADGFIQPIFKDGRYSNPWGGLWHEEATFRERLKFFFGKSHANVPRSEVRLRSTQATECQFLKIVFCKICFFFFLAISPFFIHY